MLKKFKFLGLNYKSTSLGLTSKSYIPGDHQIAECDLFGGHPSRQVHHHFDACTRFRERVVGGWTVRGAVLPGYVHLLGYRAAVFVHLPLLLSGVNAARFAAEYVCICRRAWVEGIWIVPSPNGFNEWASASRSGVICWYPLNLTSGYRVLLEIFVKIEEAGIGKIETRYVCDDSTWLLPSYCWGYLHYWVNLSRFSCWILH